MMENDYAASLIFLAFLAWLTGQWAFSEAKAITWSYAVDLITGAAFSIIAGLLLGTAVGELLA